MTGKENKKKIAAIGAEEFTLGFKLAGIQNTSNPENKEEYQKQIQELLKTEELGILIAKQADLEKLPKRIQNQAETSVEPVVVTLSEEGENLKLQEQIKKAIGADITQ